MREDGPGLGALPGFDRYEEVAEVGRGTFGVVYRARDPLMERVVAIKILSRGLDDAGRARFEHERRAMGKLSNHPHIATIFDAGVIDGHPYLVMEYMPLGSLQAVLDTSGPMTWRAAADVGVKIAGALESAHRAGILHRDLKPENLLRSEYGQPILSDFGIAIVGGGPPVDTKTAPGTIAYSAPELLEGVSPTATSDVWGLTATLYALLSGSPPFVKSDDASMSAVLERARVGDPPTLQSFGVPGEVDAVLRAGLDPDPRRRTGSARALGDSLRKAQSGAGAAATPIVIAGEEADGSVSTLAPSSVKKSLSNRMIIGLIVAIGSVLAGTFLFLGFLRSGPSSDDACGASEVGADCLRRSLLTERELAGFEQVRSEAAPGLVGDGEFFCSDAGEGLLADVGTTFVAPDDLVFIHQAVGNYGRGGASAMLERIASSCNVELNTSAPVFGDESLWFSSETSDADFELHIVYVRLSDVVGALSVSGDPAIVERQAVGDLARAIAERLRLASA